MKITYGMFLYLYRGDPSERDHVFGLRDEWITAESDEAVIEEIKEFIASLNGRVRQLWLTPKGKRNPILTYHFGEYAVDVPRPKEKQNA